MGNDATKGWHYHAHEDPHGAEKLRKRDDRPRRSVTVVVPCSHKHLKYLGGLVAAYQTQTRKPDQIVVVVSGCAASALPRVAAEVLHSSTPQTAGFNRNRGSDAARGDVILYQDADDLPHPQRVEIIAGLFEKYQIDHLMHTFDRSGTSFTEELTLKRAAKATTYRKDSRVGGLVHGNSAVARAVFTKIRWPEFSRIGEDLEFNRLVYQHTRWTAVLSLPVYYYRQHLSSFDVKHG